MSEEKIPTMEKLAQALEDAKAPQWMIDHARDGFYDDFKSNQLSPIGQLIGDALNCGLQNIADRARNGEFDAQVWESDEWAKSSEGQRIFKKLFGV